MDNMRLSDLIQPDTPAGAALFLQWEGYHVFSIPKRELLKAPRQARLFGVGGKRRHDEEESFTECALREGQEEIGDVIVGLTNAPQTLLLRGDGTFHCIELWDEPIRPRLIWEKRQHSNHGSMADSTRAYYLVAFNAELSAKPKPRNEIAALVYLTNQHISLMQAGQQLTLGHWLELGIKLDCQPEVIIPEATLLVPHGTVFLLMQECANSA
jgi:hypothetical protein